MTTPRALADAGRSVEIAEVDLCAPVVAELLDYIRWLAEQDAELHLTIGHIWTLYYAGVRCGHSWPDVCKDLGLLVREDWS